MINGPFLLLQCEPGQSADDAVLHYVRNRMTAHAIARLFPSPTYDKAAFIHLAQAVFSSVLDEGQSLILNKHYAGAVSVSLNHVKENAPHG